MSDKRDTQREKVYHAERRVFCSPETFALIQTQRDEGRKDEYCPKLHAAWDAEFITAREFVSVDDCKVFINQIKDSPHYAKMKGPRRIQVHSGAGNRNATWCEGRKQVKLPLWARSRHVICHELAHALTYRTHGSRVPPHGGVFCRHFIELVRDNISEEAAAALEDSYAQDGVRVSSLADVNKYRRK